MKNARIDTISVEKKVNHFTIYYYEECNPAKPLIWITIYPTAKIPDLKAVVNVALLPVDIANSCIEYTSKNRYIRKWKSSIFINVDEILKTKKQYEQSI